MRISRCHLFCGTILLLLTCALGTQWTPSTYPNPSVEEGFKLCKRPGKSFVCDPDSIISRKSANVIEGTIMDIRNAVDPYRNDGCTTHRTDFQGFEVTVALMEKMEVLDGSPQQVAQDFAVQLFNAWGVGDAGCQNGLLLFLSKQDRQVFIFAGRHALEVAPQAKLKLVIDRMRPLLKDGEYEQALERAIVDLGLILAGGEPAAEGEGSYWGLAIFLSIFAGIVGFICWKSWQQKRDQRKCVTLLEKLKKEQRHAINTGRYPAASCPICFEDFEDSIPSAPPLPTKSEDGKSGESPKKANESSSLINPLLKQSPQDRRGKQAEQGKQDSEESSGKQRLALPCGHTFCEPCITSWLEGHTTCPVCRKPMGSDDGGDDDSGPGPSHRRPPPPETDECGRSLTRNQQMDLYNDELQFRMLGLQRLYPWYITSDMVNHASDMNRQGQTFDFESVRQEQLAQQAQERHMHQGQFGSGSVGFGGGSSGGGGGAGGSW